MPRGTGGSGLRAPVAAPAWMQGFARDIESWAEAQRRGPLPLTVYTTAALPNAADYPFALIALSDGATNKHVAISNGVGWFYLDGSAV